MKIYTSRYQNPELQSGNYTVVGITRGAPRFPLKYTLSGNIIEFAPPGYLFSEWALNERKACYDRICHSTKTLCCVAMKMSESQMSGVTDLYLQNGGKLGRETKFLNCKTAQRVSRAKSQKTPKGK